jgi:hypothetical protein
VDETVVESAKSAFVKCMGGFFEYSNRFGYFVCQMGYVFGPGETLIDDDTEEGC